MNKKTFLFGGYSQFPQGTPGHEIYKYFGIGFEVDPDTWDIVDVSSTFLTDLSSKFLCSIFVGKNIKKGGVTEGVKEFEARYFCKGKKTIIAAIIDAEKSYSNFLTQ
ncbi:MAG: DUF3870 domain-containing protein [Cloacibacillus sp.]